jgi:PilZ domain-containing protein
VLERRAKPRLSKPFPTTVTGIDKAGESFVLSCALENISSTGLYLKMPRQLEQGSDVKLVVNFSAGPLPAARAAIRGIALRSDPQADEKWGLAVAISEYEII